MSANGPSSQAPYGPKAEAAWGINRLKSWGNQFERNEKYQESSADDHCFDTYIDSKLSQPGMGDSSLKP